MREFRVALFDLDGTLIDTEEQYTQFWHEMVRRFCPDLPGLEYRIKGTTLKQTYARYFPDPKVQKEITRALNEFEAHIRYDFIPGAMDFVRDIRRHGVRCAMVTSSNQHKMQHVARELPHLLALFDRVLTSEDFAASKPSPDCYLLGAKVFGADLQDCVVFEDALTGLEAGMRSGIYTIGLATTNPREVIQDKCSYVLDNFVGLNYEGVCRLLPFRSK